MCCLPPKCCTFKVRTRNPKKKTININWKLSYRKQKLLNHFLPFDFSIFLFSVVFSSSHISFPLVLAAARFWEPLVFSSSPIFNCSKCGRPYKTKYTLRRHERLECGLPALYKCRLCDYRAKHKHSVKQHFEGVHEKKNKFPLEVQLDEWSILSNITSIDCVIELNQMYS